MEKSVRSSSSRFREERMRVELGFENESGGSLFINPDLIGIIKKIS